MLSFLNLVFHSATGIAGVLLIYASFSYETEDGKIQSLLEEWWLRIDALREQAISFHLAFMKVIASLMTTFLNRLFGVRMLGLQSLGASACYSLVCTGLVLLMLFELYPNRESNLFNIARLIIPALVYGTLPAFVNNPAEKIWRFKFIHIWFAGLVFIFLWNVPEFFRDVIVFGLFTPGARLAFRIGRPMNH